jgi:hypothetical protein
MPRKKKDARPPGNANSADMSALLGQMSENVHDSAVQMQCLSQLLKLRGGNMDGSQMHEAARPVVRAMKAHLGEPDLQCVAYAVLGMLCSPDTSQGDFRMQEHHRRNRKCAVEEGVAEAIVAAMNTHKCHRLVQVSACCTIPVVTDGFRTTSTSTKQAAARVILAAMRLYNTDGSMLLSANSALELLCSVLDMKSDLGREAVKEVLSSMHGHAMDLELQLAACKALNAFIWRDGGGSITEVIDGPEGALDVMIPALDLIYRKEAEIRAPLYKAEIFFEASCKSIEEVYRSFDAKLNDQNCEVFLRLMEKYHTSPGLMYVAMQCLVCGTICNPENKETLGVKAIQQALIVMAANSADAAVQMSGFIMLKVFSAGVLEHIDYISQEKVLSTLVRLLEKLPGEGQVQNAAFLMFMTLAESPDGSLMTDDDDIIRVKAKKGMIKSGCVDTIVKACKTYIHSQVEEENILESGCMALSEIAHGKTSSFATRPRDVQEGIIEVCLHAMSLHKTSHDVLLHGCKAVCHAMPADLSFVAKFGRKALPIIVSAMVKFPLSTHDGFERLRARVALVSVSIVAQYMDCKDVFGRCGGFKILATCLSSYVHNGRMEEWSVKDCLQGICTACDEHRANKARCHSDGAVNAILKLVEHAKNSSESAECIQREAQIALEKIGAASVEDQRMLACSVCDRTAADVGVKRLSFCSACTIAPRFCSTECQRAGWPAHKAECKANLLRK